MNSIVLLSNGISFIIQIFVFLILGSMAGQSVSVQEPESTLNVELTDFGTWRPNILIVLTLAAIAIGFGSLGIHTPDKWMTATVIYIIGRL